MHRGKLQSLCPDLKDKDSSHIAFVNSGHLLQRLLEVLSRQELLASDHPTAKQRLVRLLAISGHLGNCLSWSHLVLLPDIHHHIAFGVASFHE